MKDLRMFRLTTSSSSFNIFKHISSITNLPHSILFTISVEVVSSERSEAVDGGDGDGLGVMSGDGDRLGVMSGDGSGRWVMMGGGHRGNMKYYTAMTYLMYTIANVYIK